MSVNYDSFVMLFFSVSEDKKLEEYLQVLETPKFSSHIQCMQVLTNKMFSSTFKMNTDRD